MLWVNKKDKLIIITKCIVCIVEKKKMKKRNQKRVFDEDIDFLQKAVNRIQQRKR